MRDSQLLPVPSSNFSQQEVEERCVAWQCFASCGPHKLVPQQKLSEFNGELVARPKVSTFCGFFGVVKIGK